MKWGGGFIIINLFDMYIFYDASMLFAIHALNLTKCDKNECRMDAAALSKKRYERAFHKDKFNYCFRFMNVMQ